MTRPGAALPELLNRAFEQRAAVSDQDADVLRAALAVLRRKGTRNVTVDAIAAEAGLSRMTVFRRFGAKDSILEAAVRWAVERLLAEITEVLETIEDTAERTVEVFVRCCRYGHTLLLASHPDDRVALFTGEEDSLIDLGVQFGMYQMTTRQNRDEDPEDTRMRADALVRLTLACLIEEPSPFDLTDELAARRYARIALVPIATS